MNNVLVRRGDGRCFNTMYIMFQILVPNCRRISTMCCFKYLTVDSHIVLFQIPNCRYAIKVIPCTISETFALILIVMLCLKYQTEDAACFRAFSTVYCFMHVYIVSHRKFIPELKHQKTM